MRMPIASNNIAININIGISRNFSAIVEVIVMVLSTTSLMVTGDVVIEVVRIGIVLSNI